MKNYYGGFWIRFCAIVVDTVIISVFTGIINKALGLNVLSNQTDLSPKAIFATLFGLLVGVFYYSVLQGMLQGTIGKKAMGLVLVDEKTLGKISFGQSIGRYMMCWVSALCLGIGYIMVGFSDKKQGWHDRVAGTLVVKKDMLKTLSEDEGVFLEKSA